MAPEIGVGGGTGVGAEMGTRPRVWEPWDRHARSLKQDVKQRQRWEGA